MIGKNLINVAIEELNLGTSESGSFAHAAGISNGSYMKVQWREQLEKLWRSLPASIKVKEELTFDRLSPSNR